MPSLKKTLVYFLPVQVKKAKDSEIFATKRKMCWLRKGPDGQGVWEVGGGQHCTHSLYKQHTLNIYGAHNKGDAKKAKEQMGWLQSGAGWPKAATIVHAWILGKNKWTCTKTNIEEENTENELITMGVGPTESAWGWHQGCGRSATVVDARVRFLFADHGSYAKYQGTKQQKTLETSSKHQSLTCKLTAKGGLGIKWGGR